MFVSFSTGSGLRFVDVSDFKELGTMDHDLDFNVSQLNTYLSEVSSWPSANKRIVSLGLLALFTTG